ncbi:hypothetical protein KDL44_13295 [bacterium]|nr:hypothetical protein [bacterium]
MGSKEKTPSLSGTIRNTCIYLLLALATSCGSGSADSALAIRNSDASANVSLTEFTLPDFPPQFSAEELARLERQSSFNLNDSIEGSEFASHGPGTVQIQGDDLLVERNGEALHWVIYGLPGLGPTSNLTSMSLALNQLTADTKLYLGVSDYEAGRWNFSTIQIDDSEMVVDILDRFDPVGAASPDGMALIALLTDNADFGVDFISYSGQTDLLVPQITSVTNGTHEDRIVVNWSGVAHAAEIEIFYKLEEEPEDAWALLFTANTGGNGLLNHTENQPPAKGSLYGKPYLYRARAKLGEERSEFSAVMSGERRTPHPISLGASYQVYSDQIRFYFFTDIAYEDFSIFRDDVKIADFSAPGIFGKAFVDNAPGPGEHLYHVVVEGPNGPSFPSEKIAGCTSEWEPATLISRDDPEAYHADIADIHGVACVSYSDGTNGELLFHRVSGPDAGSHVVCEADVDVRTDLAVIEGRPMLAFHNADDAALEGRGTYLALATTPVPTGTLDWDVQLIAGGSSTALRLRLIELSDRLGLFFSSDSGTGEQLFYAQSTDKSPGPADWTASQVTNEPYDPLFDGLAYRDRPVVVAQRSAAGPMIHFSTELQPDELADWNSDNTSLVLSYSDLVVYEDSDDVRIQAILPQDGAEDSRMYSSYVSFSSDFETNGSGLSNLYFGDDLTATGLSMVVHNNRRYFAWNAALNGAPYFFGNSERIGSDDQRYTQKGDVPAVGGALSVSELATLCVVGDELMLLYRDSNLTTNRLNLSVLPPCE